MELCLMTSLKSDPISANPTSMSCSSETVVELTSVAYLLGPSTTPYDYETAHLKRANQICYQILHSGRFAVSLHTPAEY